MTAHLRKIPGILATVGLLCRAGAAAPTADPAMAGDPVVLTTATQVRELAKSEAAKHLCVELQGIVIGEAHPESNGFAIQDGTGGIYVESTTAAVAQLHPGDCVTIKGVSDPGTYAPFVAADGITKTGRKELPEPRHVTYEEMASGKLDAQWVEVRGIVRYCEPSPNDPRKYRIELATGGGRLVVRWNVASIPTSMVDAEVRLRGVCYYLVNRRRQFLSPMLAIPGEVPVITEVPPPADPYSAPLRSASSLLQFAPEGSYGHRVHVRGVVIGQQPGESLWIRDGDRGLLVHATQSGEAHPGDEVDVLGFPIQSDYSPLLEDATFRTGPAHSCPPAPLRLADATNAFDHDADLVELEAMVSDREPAARGWTFKLLAADGAKFEASLRGGIGDQPPPGSRPGSRVRVAGVCTVFRDHSGFVSGLSHPRAFQLLLRSAADLSLIEPPPWWTRRRITWALSAIAGISLLGVAGVVVAARLRLREQAQQRSRAEAEFSAILGERNRLAREIHDILAQGLSAIILHLDLVKDDLRDVSARGAKHLLLAHRVARDSMADAGNAVWNLRSQVLENGDLASALEGVLRQLTEGTHVDGHFELTGNSRRLQPVTENAILRIGQEAITNAAKHGHPDRIEVTLKFTDKLVILRVRDNGCGFDNVRPAPRSRSFGLQGMRERAGQLGGHLGVHSRPGHGTEISLAVAVAL